MTIKLGMIMDPIGSIHYEKDSTLAMLLEAQQRAWEINYFELSDLWLQDGQAGGHARRLTVYQDANHWFELGEQRRVLFGELDVIFMRQDPPVDQAYLYATYLLDHAVQAGKLVVNHPQALRDVNEKCFTGFFPTLTPPTLITQSQTDLQAFWQQHGEIVVKPLDGMGGRSVFRLQPGDPNANAVFSMLTKDEKQFCMAQRFIPAIVAGDKRILMIDGKPISHALARVPSAKDWRGNLAVGAKGVAQPLTARDQFICDQVGPMLREKGLLFVGLDVIGDYLTEINVTSPTGIREIHQETGVNASALLLDCVEKKLAQQFHGQAEG